MGAPKQDLPKLPVPSLQQTMQRFLRSSKPLLTDEEFKVSEKLAKEFSEPGGIGEKLQQILYERAAVTENWLQELWLNYAYLGFRSPLTVFSSTGISLPFRNIKCKEDQLKFAAAAVAGILDFKVKLYDCEYPIEKMGPHPLDMSQFYDLIGACRIPGEKCDTQRFLNVKNPAKHIAVVHNYHFFSVPVYDENDKVLNQSQIVDQLKKVVAQSTEISNTPVGILTTDSRDNWYKAYTMLRKIPENCESLEMIQSALFLLCLDGPPSSMELTAPNLEIASAYKMMHGGGSQSNSGNRWCDKVMQLVIGPGGEMGLPFEHSVGDGYPIGLLMESVDDYCTRFNGEADPIPRASSSFEAPRKLNFTVSSEVETSLETAKYNLGRLIEDFNIYLLRFRGYGKDFIKTQKFSPDSFMQMALQFTFFRLYNKPCAQYEAAATRMFRHGRTETIRSCSIESVHFARTMLNPEASDSEKASALKNAIKAHREYVRFAVEGQGVDRHLLGLRLMASQHGMEIPKLFQDAAYIKSSHMRLSTSQVTIKPDCFLYFGPVVPDGYGCCYNLHGDKLLISVTSFNACKETSSIRFCQMLEQSLYDMKKVLTSVSLRNKI